MRRTAALIFVLGIICGMLRASTAEALCTLPYQLTNGQVADATQVMADFNALATCLGSAPAGSNNAVQIKTASGFGGVGPLANGQVLIGSTGNPPQAHTLTAGSGIAIANGAGTVSISATGAAFQRELGPYAPPTASSFTFIDSVSSVTPSVSDVANVGLVYSTPVVSNNSIFPGAYQAVPASVPWTLTMRAKYSAMTGNNPEFGIWIKDTSGKMLGEVMEPRTGAANIVIKRCTSNTSLSANPYIHNISGIPDWFRVTYDGVNINFYLSWDSQNWLYVWTETSTTFLNGNLQYVGIGGIPAITDTTAWRPGSTMGAVVTYWNIAS